MIVKNSWNWTEFKFPPSNIENKNANRVLSCNLTNEFSLLIFHTPDVLDVVGLVIEETYSLQFEYDAFLHWNTTQQWTQLHSTMKDEES